MIRPRLLDLFCGVGGASFGYWLSGFDVLGVDVEPQPHYPFDFVQADALAFLDSLEWGGSFELIHASPPCQRFSTATKRNRTEERHPDLIAPTRERLQRSGVPYVLENVIGAPLAEPVLACGTALGLTHDGFRLRRHRLFESSVDLGGVFQPCACELSVAPVLDVTGGGDTRKPRTDGGGGRPRKGTADQARAIMRIPWATKTELNEAIPPAYTLPIGRRARRELRL